MNIELTPTEAKVLKTILEADIRKMGFNFEHCSLLSGIIKKTTYTPAEEHYRDDQNRYYEGYETYTHSQRWGK